ncbi:MAG: DUF354 domain-containing protein, partial [Nitrososphaerota archaeon]
IVPVVNALAESYKNDIYVVVLPRYVEQVQLASSVLHKSVHVPRTAIDGTSLLFFTSVFVGAGGTMTAEAALLGTPTISCYPGNPTLMEKYLIRKKLISRVTESEKIVRRIDYVLKNLGEERRLQRERATKLTANMENPVDVMAQYVEKSYPP